MQKRPYDWNEQDVRDLIAAGTEESLYLDYKASDSLQKTEGRKNEISKDVSAFANSAGGTLLYGVSERIDPNGGRKVPDQIDGGYDPADISPEWLEQVINSRIQQRIDGILINPIRLSDPYQGRVLYAVNVPQSGRAPHQASDKRYYKRFNFESVPMEDYEVRDVANRSRVPILRVQVNSRLISRASQQHVYRIVINVKNDGGVRARDIALKLWWPRAITQKQRGGGYREREGTDTHFVYEVRFTEGQLVIFPGESTLLTDGTLDRYHIEYLFNDEIHRAGLSEKLLWEMYADDAPAQKGEVPFEQLNEY